MPPRLSVIIPCYQSESTLGVQLSALAAQCCDRSWEVIVADNGSSDGTLTVARSFASIIPALRIIDASARRGAAYARNAGAAVAAGNALLFCDADDEMAPGYAQAMARALDTHDFVACRYDFQKLNVSWLAHARGGGGQSDGPAGGYCHPTLPYAGAGGLGISKAVHNAVGGFDLTLKAMAGQEDTDYCIRVQLAGTPLVYVPDAVMRVRFRDSIVDVFRQAWAWAESGAYVQRRYARPQAAAALPARTAVALARHLAWKLLRLRTRADVAQWIWLAGWSGGLVTALRRLARDRG
jgi:glycosyltransferase involved in cell wall biosynthesis